MQKEKVISEKENAVSIEDRSGCADFRRDSTLARFPHYCSPAAKQWRLFPRLIVPAKKD